MFTAAARRDRPQGVDSGRSPWLRNRQVRPTAAVCSDIDAALLASAGGSSKREKRWHEYCREPQVEALSKRQEADPVRWKHRAGVLQQSRLRSRRWPRSAMPGLLGRRRCPPARPHAKRRALCLQVQQGVPLPRRRAAPLVGNGDYPCKSWPRPSQTVAQHGPPYPSTRRVILHGSHVAMTTDLLGCHAAHQSGDHFQCRLVGREQPLNGGEHLRCRTGPFGVVWPATTVKD